MDENAITIEIEASLRRGSGRPTGVRFQIRATADETADDIGKAITETCRQLNFALKEAIR